jgi:hypothetical protein
MDLKNSFDMAMSQRQMAVIKTVIFILCLLPLARLTGFACWISWVRILWNLLPATPVTGPYIFMRHPRGDTHT